MTKTNAGGWIAGTVAIALVMLVASYMLLISPTLASASDTRTQAQSQVDANQIAKSKIAALKKQFENMDALKAQLAQMQGQLPPTEDMATYRRQLDGVAVAHSVTINTLTIGEASGVTAPAAAAPAVDPNAPAPDPNAPAVAAPAAPAPTTYSVSVSIDVAGSYDNVLAFLQDVQLNVPRIFLVKSLTGTAATPAPAAAGRPAIVDGDLQLTISGSTFVLAPTTAPTPDPAATPAPLQPANGRNPLVAP